MDLLEFHLGGRILIRGTWAGCPVDRKVTSGFAVVFIGGSNLGSHGCVKATAARQLLGYDAATPRGEAGRDNSEASEDVPDSCLNTDPSSASIKQKTALTHESWDLIAHGSLNHRYSSGSSKSTVIRSSRMICSPVSGKPGSEIKRFLVYQHESTRDNRSKKPTSGDNESIRSGLRAGTNFYLRDATIYHKYLPISLSSGTLMDQRSEVEDARYYGVEKFLGRPLENVERKYIKVFFSSISLSAVTARYSVRGREHCRFGIQHADHLFYRLHGTKDIGPRGKALEEVDQAHWLAIPLQETRQRSGERVFDLPDGTKHCTPDLEKAIGQQTEISPGPNGGSSGDGRGMDL
nr:hypothetical protein Iba_chr01cCG1950 [Ipomoea batatas]